MSRHITSATILIAVTAVLAGCVPGLAADPRFATNSRRPAARRGHHEAATRRSAADRRTQERLVVARLHVAGVRRRRGRGAPGVKLDCANYDADLDPVNGGSGTLSIGVVRARSDQTPRDAGPLVFTTGSDLPSSTQLPVWLSRAGADVLRTHPIVAVDRRGMGMSSPIDCRDHFDRQEMRDQAQFQSGDDPVANLSDISNTATTNCTDAIAPGDSAYDNSHAASDIERLRNLWDVPAVALVGIGNGAQVALAYAGSRPDKVARLILDSPIALGVNAEAAAEQQVKGQQAALDAFAAQCVAVNCALGPDPKGAVTALLADARAGKGPGGASVAQLANAITIALGFPTGGRVNATTGLANALAAARSGDTNPLTSLINRADATGDSDGQFVNCLQRRAQPPHPGPGSRIGGRLGEALSPVRHGRRAQPGQMRALADRFAAAAAEGPQDRRPCCWACRTTRSWARKAVAATAATIINASAASKRVMWQGIGHGASIYSSCAVPPLIGYLDSGKLPGTDTYCPA